MAHTKAGGSTALGRDSRPQYLGVKLHDGAARYVRQKRRVRHSIAALVFVQIDRQERVRQARQNVSVR